MTANATTGSHEVEGASPLEIVTGNVPNISGTFKFPFGCPVTSTKTEDGDHHYSTNSEIGIAVGSSSGSNHSTLVYIPGKGTRAWPRLDVRALKMQQPGAASEIDKTKLQPIIGGDWRSIEFKSSAPIPDLSAEPSDDA